MMSLQELRKAFTCHEALPFPHHSGISQELSDLHAELVEYDGFVAGLVSSLLGGVPVDAAEFRHDTSIGAALKDLAAREGEPVRSEAKAHLAYYHAVDHLLQIASRSR